MKATRSSRSPSERATRLGPLFIRDACSACHQGDGRGPGSVTKLAVVGADPELEKRILPFGSTARPYVAAGAKLPLVSPADHRVRATSLLPPCGLGPGLPRGRQQRRNRTPAREAAARTGPDSRAPASTPGESSGGSV